MSYRFVFSISASTLFLLAAPLEAQPALPLAPIPPGGEMVSPFFEGWYANPDGTYTLSFGYLNRNMNEAVEIPLGEGNFIRPAQFDGKQPTYFTPTRERGVFGIVVPPDFQGDVVWTLVRNGTTHFVPGRITSPAYEMSHKPMAAGSTPPAVRFDSEGEPGRGPAGTTSGPLTTSVGVPLTLHVRSVDDRSVRDSDVPLNVSWYKFQGPGAVSFSEDVGETGPGGGEVSTEATFAAPGAYLVRVRVDNFAASDSNHQDQCCWTNGYLQVDVTP
ncbi:MAG: hypothetical protein WD766_15430 [Gemmatimonadota bacterium]